MHTNSSREISRERIHRHRREFDIKINLKNTEFKDVEWIHLAQNRVQWWAYITTVTNV